MCDDYEDDGRDDWDECDHDQYDIDILTGRAECNRCPHWWYVDGDAINREIERQREYSEWEHGESRRQWWHDRTYSVRIFFFRVLQRVWPRKSLSVLHDDEIPF